MIKKRTVLVAGILLVGIAALSAAPAMRQGRSGAFVEQPNAQVAMQQRVMAQACLDAETLEALPEELQLQIEQRRAEAESRQALNAGQRQAARSGQRGYGKR